MLFKSPGFWGVVGLLLLFMVYVLPRVVPVTVFTGGSARGAAIIAGAGCLAYAAVLLWKSKQPPAV